MAFTYDSADRITSITNGMNNSYSQSLGYDALNRLTSVNSTADNESYSYDADGNRTSMVVNGSTVAFTMDPNSNRLITAGGTTFGYDANGNTLTANGTTLYQYGSFNRLANANGTAYRTSAEGQRIFKSGTPGTTYFAPDEGGTLMAEYDPNGVWLDYIWLNGKLVTVVTSNGGVYPVHDDQTGRPIAMTNLGNQSVIWAAQNLPFTRNVTTSTWFNFNLGFPGQYQDAEDGIWHNGDRDYNAYLGRYIESDPIGLAGGINTYAYVGNNPITRIDPLGLQCTLLQRIGNAIGNFLNDHTQLELAFDAGDGLGASGDITITNSGVYGRFGVGFGIGWGVSLSGGGHVGDASGLDVTVSATGGDGYGGTAQGTASQGGLAGTGSLGFGVEGGATATVGYGGKIANLPAALSHGHSSGCGCH